MDEEEDEQVAEEAAPAPEVAPAEPAAPIAPAPIVPEPAAVAPHRIVEQRRYNWGGGIDD
jgi:hypothetical protein